MWVCGVQPYYSMPSSLILLVDGLALAYRAYHAIPHLTSSAGEPTNALFGFIKMVRQLDEQWRPTHRAVVFDGGLPKMRLALLPTYKAQRDPMPESLRAQLEPIGEFLRLAGWTTVRPSDEEADDALATLAVAGAREDGQVLMASHDKDLLQVVSPQIWMIAPTKDAKPQGPEAVQAKMGVRPDQVVDLLAMTGDTVDNIPGVPGIGPKTAARLLGTYGTMEAIWEHLDQVEPVRIRELLRQHQDVVVRNRRLMRLRTDLEGLPPVEQLMVRRAEIGQLVDFLERHGLQSVARAYRDMDLELF